MIKTENLGRHFGAIKAVDGVSFKAQSGEVLGFLGPNGAGKSTTMKMLTCFLTPSFGTATVGGADIVKDPTAVRSALGYLPENAPLYGDMSVAEFLNFIGEVRGMSATQVRVAIERVVSLTTLSAVMHQKIDTLSKGFKRRVGLAQALIHDPQILILDEPTDGLDPNQKHEVRTLINSMAKEKCILLSTHILEEVEEVCNRVVIIAHGKIVADDTPDGLRKRSSSHGAVTLRFAKNPDKVRPQLEAISGVKSVSDRGRAGEGSTFVLLPKPGQEILFSIVREVERQKWTVSDLRVEEGALDEVFRTITR